jgi:hypothetical protein
VTMSQAHDWHNHDQLVCLPFESSLSVDVLITTKNWMLRMVNYWGIYSNGTNLQINYKNSTSTMAT